MYIEFQIYSTDDIKNQYQRKTNGHWFDKDTMAFFKCRLDGQVFAHDSKRLFYFVSSEKGPDDKRKSSIRSYDPTTGKIDTVGEFQQYATPSRAKKHIEKMIKENP